LPARCAKFLKTSTKSAGIPSSVPSESALSQTQEVTTLCIAASTKETRPLIRDSVLAANVQRSGGNLSFGSGEIVLHELMEDASFKNNK